MKNIILKAITVIAVMLTLMGLTASDPVSCIALVTIGFAWIIPYGYINGIFL